jgi:hypothetical protein
MSDLYLVCGSRDWPAPWFVAHNFDYNTTAHTIRAAYKRGITLHHFTEKNLLPDIAALDMGDIE